MVHQDSTIDVTTSCRAASHLPPAGIRGGARKICSSLLSGPHSPLFFFAPCQLGEPKRHRGPFFWAVAHRRCVIGEKLVSFVLSSVPLSPPLNCPAATPCPPPCLRLSTHTYIHPPTQPQLHKGNEIEREMSCVSVKDLRWCGDGLSGWCTVASQGYTLFRMIATNRKAFICKTSLI